MTKRVNFPVSVQTAAHDRANGHCEGCGQPLGGRRGECDHIQPAGLGGPATLSNAQILCPPCHKAKTHGEDRPVMAKADMQKKKARGIKSQRGPPMPGTKRSGLRKRMNGNVERRVGDNGDKA
jgi:5-methylcytosine-specific restriction protein A